MFDNYNWDVTNIIIMNTAYHLVEKKLNFLMTTTGN